MEAAPQYLSGLPRLSVLAEGLAGTSLTDPFGLWRGLGVENVQRGALHQGGNAPKCSGAHPSFEQHPLTSSRLWADTTFLPADSPGRMIEHHHAVSGASACTSARTDCGAEAEKASSLAATHDTLFLDEALLFGDDLHHEAFLIEGTEHDAQVPDLDLGLDTDAELSEALFRTLGEQPAKPVPCTHSAFAHCPAPDLISEGCWLAQASLPQQSNSALSTRSSADADGLCFWPDLPETLEPYVAPNSVLALPRYYTTAQETIETRYGSVNSSARGAEQQAPEAPDSVLLPHMPAPPSGAAPLGMCLVPVFDGAPLPRTGSTRTLTLSTSSLSVAQLTQQHRQDEALSEDEDEEEPEEEEDDEADPSFSGEPAACAKPGGRAAKRKLPTKNSDEGTSAACTASGAKAAKKAEGAQAPVSARGRTSKPRRFYSQSADSDDDDASDGSNRRRKHHNPWTVEETEALVVGVERCGGGKWADIKKLGFSVIAQRSPVDLKDKWRNLMRVALLPCPGSPNRVKIEKRREVPQDLLDRVRILCENGANAKPAPAPALPKPAAPARARRA